MTTKEELLALLDSNPHDGLLAVADLRESRARDAAAYGGWSVAPGPSGDLAIWVTDPEDPHRPADVLYERELGWTGSHRDAFPHVATEANPEHALAGVALWRRIVEHHADDVFLVQAAAGAARAYVLGGP